MKPTNAKPVKRMITSTKDAFHFVGNCVYLAKKVFLFML